MKYTIKNMKAGEPLEVDQLATFAHYVQGEQFRFVVLRMPDGETSLTHRESGKRVAVLPRLTLAHDYVDAGKRAIEALVKKHGEARVRGVLAGA